MLDTDICIYIIKQKPLSVLEHFKQISPTQLSMSAITFAELMNGAKKSQQIEANIARLVRLADMLEIRPFDQQAAVVYGDVRSSLEKQGEVIGAYDLLIAAHALSLERTLVTNNVKEFSRIKELKIENWTIKIKKPGAKI
jgi:tRNA(fMet)-specific endonuclease VapC